MVGERLVKANIVAARRLSVRRGIGWFLTRWRGHHELDREFMNRLFPKLRKTNVDCSCGFCGNPRRYEGGSYKLTVQERKAPKISEQWD